MKRTENEGERQARGQNMEEKDKQEDRIWRRKTSSRTEYGGERQEDRIWRRKTMKRTEYEGERQARGQNMEEKDKQEDRIWRKKTVMRI